MRAESDFGAVLLKITPSGVDITHPMTVSTTFGTYRAIYSVVTVLWAVVFDAPDCVLVVRSGGVEL